MKTCPSPQFHKMKMHTSAHIYFFMLVSVAKWTALSRASDIGAIPWSLGMSAQLQRCDSWYLKRESKWSGFGLKSNLTASWWSSAMNGHGLFHELRSQPSGGVSAPITYLGNPVSMTRWGVCDVIWFVRVWVVYSHHLWVNYLAVFFFMTGWRNFLDGII